MPITRQNGVLTPAPSDAYALTNDLATMADTSNVLTPVTSVTARNELTPFEGMAVVRLDKRARIEVYRDGAWQGDTEWQTAGATPATGWSAEDLLYRVIGPIATIRGVVTRTGANINSGPLGNIANTKVVSIPVELWPVYYQGIGSAYQGRAATFQVTSQGGIDVMAVAAAGSPVSTGEKLSFSGSYLLD